MSCYRKCIKPAPAPLDCVAKEWLSAELILSCPLGYNDNEVTVPAGTVRSSISQEDADEQALALAEAQLICTLEVAFDRSVLWGFVDVFAFDTATASATAHDGILAGAGVVPFEPSTATANGSAYDAGMGVPFAPSVATAAGAAYDATIANAGYLYHRMDYGVSGLVGLTEIKFTLANGSDYPLTTSTITTPHSWSFLGAGSIAMLGNGSIAYGTELAYSAGSGGYVSVRAQTPIAVSVKEVLTGTQANYNGAFNLPQSLRYYVSINGADWTLVKDIPGVFGGGTGYIVKNVEP